MSLLGLANYTYINEGYGTLASHCLLGKKAIAVQHSGLIFTAGCDYQVVVPLWSDSETTEGHFVMLS